MPPKYTILCEKGQCSFPRLLPDNPYVAYMDLDFDEEAIPKRNPSKDQEQTNQKPQVFV